jgi:hypothetical protein
MQSCQTGGCFVENSKLKSGLTDYFLTDALGIVRQIGKQSGSLTLGQVNNPFGNSLGWSGIGGSTYGMLGNGQMTTGCSISGA